MNEKTYNGWHNYETWNVKLWMDNEEGSYHHCREMAQASWDAADDSDGAEERLSHATYNLASTLKDEYEEAMADILESARLQSSVWADLLGAALSEVNWHEIAEHMMEDVDKTVSVPDDADDE